MKFLEYNVIHGMNITDVGHLVGDTDGGEDKMDKASRLTGKHPLEIAKYFEGIFFEDLAKLNILPPDKLLRATESVPEQIEIIKLLEEKGFAYVTSSGVFFDTSKLSDYGKLSGQLLSEKKTGAREEVKEDVEKRNPADFALWFFLVGKYENHILKWASPWGEGFPGWHIECSAISRKLLGQPFDIHCGGVDHIGTHHANEIAQSEAAYNIPLSNVWMHGEFLLINGGRMGKSEGNLKTLTSLTESGFSPAVYRYLCLTAHYRTQLNFTEDNLTAAKNALDRLINFVSLNYSDEVNSATLIPEFLEEFTNHISNDLDIPQAVGTAWKMLSSDYPTSEKLATLLKFDEVFGLDLKSHSQIVLPPEIVALIKQRDSARVDKNFSESDRLRDELSKLGYEVLDTAEGTKVKKI